MGRPREFEEEEALRRAAGVFLAKGYHATSLDDLTSGMGLSKGSVYKAFHDKRQLFLQALELYARESLGRFSETLEAPGSVRDALRTTLIGYQDRVRAGANPGCLLTNTAIELGPQDPEVAAQVSGIFSRRAALLADAVRRAQAAGEISVEVDPAQAAAFLELVVQGLRVQVRTGGTRDEAVRAVDFGLRVLG